MKRIICFILALTLCATLLQSDSWASSDFIIEDDVLLKYVGSNYYVTIPDTVVSIGNYAFADCVGLHQISIPETVLRIGEYAFVRCNSLERLEIPDSVVAIGKCAFSCCMALSNVTIGSGVREIGDFAFSECCSLEDIIVHDGVTSLGWWTFSQCTNLKSVTCTDSGSVVLTGAEFPGCRRLETFINCHLSPEYEARIQDAHFVVNQWANPGCFVKPQSLRISNLANEITKGLERDSEKAEAIFQWVVTNISYDRDYANGLKDASELSTTEDMILNTRVAVCGGFTLLTKALLQAVNIPSYAIGGEALSYSGWSEHGWNLTWLDGQWVWMDSTFGMDWYSPTEVAFAADHAVARDVLASNENDVPSVWAQPEVRDAIQIYLIPFDLQNS